MKKKFQFYKNLIMTVASALTLIAVSFAWFSTNTQNMVNTYDGYISAASLMNVEFQKEVGNGIYTNFDGDITVDNASAGSYSKYKMLLSTQTSERLKIQLLVEDLPSGFNKDLANHLYVNYVIKAVNKKTTGGKITYTDGSVIASSASNVYFSSLLNKNSVTSDVLLGSYQKSNNDYFVIYYTIGLDKSASINLSGMKTDLGKVKIVATLDA